VSDLSAEMGAALRRLGSPDLKTHVGAVEDLAHVVNEVIDRVLEEFARPGPARYPIFERLGRFGSLAVDPLEQLLVRSEDRELRVLTAAALLSLGSRAGVEVLLDAVRADDPLVCLAVRVLADSGIGEAVPRIEQAVYQCDLRKTAILECLIVGLRRFSGQLSEGVRARLLAVEPAWLRDSLLR
jgi:HEAT repeat protein